MKPIFTASFPNAAHANEFHRSKMAKVLSKDYHVVVTSPNLSGVPEFGLHTSTVQPLNERQFINAKKYRRI